MDRSSQLAAYRNQNATTNSCECWGKNPECWPIYKTDNSNCSGNSWLLTETTQIGRQPQPRNTESGVDANQFPKPQSTYWTRRTIAEKKLFFSPTIRSTNKNSPKPSAQLKKLPAPEQRQPQIRSGDTESRIRGNLISSDALKTRLSVFSFSRGTL